MRRSHLVGSWVRYGTADQFQMGHFNESPFWCAFFGVNELISLHSDSSAVSSPFLLTVSGRCLTISDGKPRCGKPETDQLGGVKRTQLSPSCDLTFETARTGHSLARSYTTAVLNQIIKSHITYKMNAL
jgi:hypothetical protein